MEEFNKSDLANIQPQGLEQLLKQLEPVEVPSDSFERMLSALENPKLFEADEVDQDNVVTFEPPNRKEVSVFDGYSHWDALKDRVIIAFDGYGKNVAQVASVAAIMVLAFMLALRSETGVTPHSVIDLAENAPQPSNQVLKPEFVSSSSNGSIVQVSNSESSMLAGVNQGIIWDDEQIPHMCVKVKKIKLVPVNVADGEIAFKQEPIVEYFLAPCTVD